MWEYNHSDELCHHGIKGQKWGVRRYQNPDGTLTAKGKARQKYKDAKKEYKDATKEYGRSGGFGIEAYNRTRAARDKMYDAEMRELDARAKYKASKAKTAEKAEKAELKTYTKELTKTGLPGSTTDNDSGGRSARIYDHLVVSRGKEYADKAVKKVESKSIALLASAGAVAAGSAAVLTYLDIKNN